MTIHYIPQITRVLCQSKLLLNLVEGNDITTLDVLIARLFSKILFNEIVNGNKIIYNSQHDLQLLNTKSHRNKLSCKKEKWTRMNTEEKRIVLNKDFNHQKIKCQIDNNDKD